MTLCNLPYYRQSKRNNILLSAIAERKNIKSRDDLIKLFKPLVDSVNEINNNPIILNNNYKVKVVLASVVADNPASNEMNGICMSFRWNACKNCEVYLGKLIYSFNNKFIYFLLFVFR